MKFRIFIIMGILMLSWVSSISQISNKFNYQVVVRDAAGAVIANTTVAFKISLTDATGTTPFYVETHSKPTSAQGVVSLIVGSGTFILGDLNSVPWNNGDIKLKVEIDPQGGNSFVDMGSNTLLSVPFSLVAGNGISSIADNGDGTFTYYFTNGGQYITPNLTGPKGDKGDQGETGPMGSQGLKGDTGETGSQGIKGDKGDTGTIGPQGEQGPVGPQGPAGTGLNNKGDWTNGTTYNPSDYVFAESTNNPLVNSMWIVESSTSFLSTTQPKDDPSNWAEFEAPAGPQGPQGIQGETGSAGPQGIQGDVGPAGPKGDTGDTGAQGAQGDIGPVGPKGDKGDKGDTGPEGVSIEWLGTFSSHPLSPNLNQAYYNDTDNKSYIYDGTTWQIMTYDGVDGINGLPGANGSDGLSIIWKGDSPTVLDQPETNWAYYNITDKVSYVFNGADWDTLAADGAQGPSGPLVSGTNGQTLTHDGTSWVATNAITLNGNNVGIGTTTPLTKLVVQSEATAQAEDPIFEVRNKDGKVVLGVYNEGVRVYVADSPTKGAKGGFAVGGLTNQTKGDVEYFHISPDSARIYIKDNYTKGAKGGFAVGGLTNQTKGNPYNLLFVAPDSTRIYIKDTLASGKGAKGGFAVGGLTNQTKALQKGYMMINPDSTRFYIDESTKGAKGGFAVGGLTNQTKGSSNFFNISTDASGVIDPGENRVLWYPLKNAFLTGRVLVVSPDSVGENSFASGYESKASGSFSQAMGYKTKALGEYSTAIGKNANAKRDNSYAFGEGATVNTLNSYAFGKNAKTTVGYGEMIDNGNFAFGENAISTGNYSYALGRFSLAVGANAFALGEASSATKNDAYAFGLLANASDTGAVAFGSKSYASKWYSMAIGSAPLAGTDSISASGRYSYAIGYNSRVTGDYSFAIGSGSKIDGVANITASGKHSMVFGAFARSNNHNGTFVFGDWASDYTSADLLKATTDNQFIARATGGYVWHTDKSLTESKTIYVGSNSGSVGIGVASPDHQLSILGSTNNLVRLIGTGTNGSGARLTLGDINKTYIEEDADNKLKINAYDRLAITGQYGLKVGVGDENPTDALTIYSPNDKGALKIYGNGDTNGWNTKLSFGTDDKTYLEHYAIGKMKFKIYNQLDFTGETNFKINIGSVITQDHRVNIETNNGYALKLISTDWPYTGAKLTFGDTDGTYIQEYEDNKLELFGYGLALNGSSNYFKVGIKTTNPSTLLDVGGGIRNRVSETGKNLLVANDVEVDNNLYVEGVLTVGVSGTGIGSIIKHIEYRDITSIAANGAKIETFTVSGVTLGAVVTISPYDALTNGLNISYARVSASNTVEVKFYNATGSAIDPSGTTFYIAIIN